MYIVSCLYDGSVKEKRYVYEVNTGYQAIKEFVRADQNSQTVKRLRITRLE